MKNKIKLGLALLVWIITTQSYAACSKSEVLKLIDKGFSKSEISSICDMQTQQPVKAKKSKSKWISPSRKACTKNGGKLKPGGFCSADWYSAKRICRTAGGKLPSIEELKSVVNGCGGEINDYDNNKNDSSYQRCYKQKGFSDSDYWSSSVYVSDSNDAWSVRFGEGSAVYFGKANEIYVHCVRGRL